jgi:hypothetical protein
MNSGMVMGRLQAAMVLVVVLVSTRNASAQFARRGRWYRGLAVGTGLRIATGGYGYGFPYRYGYPYGYGYGYTGTTPYGDYARGMAQVIRARGQAAEDYTQAQINQQEARSRYLDNQKKWNELYRARREQAAADKQARMQQQQEWYKKHLARQRQELPGFTSSDRALDSGTIQWPKALQSTEFAMLRQQLQELFDLKAKTDGSVEIRKKALAGTREMERLLRRKMREIPKDEYLAARSFLDRLVNESRN